MDEAAVEEFGCRQPARPALWTRPSRCALRAHLLVSTSVIEGNPLTLVEAQAMGMPIAMYELPWVETTKDNDGVSAVRQGSVTDLAHEIARISRDPADYAKLSEASLAAARRARGPMTWRTFTPGCFPKAFRRSTRPHRRSPTPPSSSTG
ncbi:glycosyltransferase [Agromyces flavus]|uniref:glycosyltransferase n=1 Tax=Agromyces flavus TaxID=589382 RepID=UPI003612866F